MDAEEKMLDEQLDDSQSLDIPVISGSLELQEDTYSVEPQNVKNKQQNTGVMKLDLYKKKFYHVSGQTKKIVFTVSALCIFVVLFVLTLLALIKVKYALTL